MIMGYTQHTSTYLLLYQWSARDPSGAGGFEATDRGEEGHLEGPTGERPKRGEWTQGPRACEGCLRGRHLEKEVTRGVHQPPQR